ncbi:RNA polymerase sigma factor [Sandaracinus amylolyticus]|uniref:RNA polymerase sigma factor n=1 Tax=Sandaracinus amylolyticus TaxID=927083 RepID=UPI001F39FA43|nr:sigma-70 family RNA polymerase sigma factor [Sandaracinus amylolyticus]UJR83084.1 Hypothetical protein I5071_51500 [Sandaracinus amylolyticus]
MFRGAVHLPTVGIELPRHLRLVGTAQDGAGSAQEDTPSEARPPIDTASAFRLHGSYVTRVALRFLGRTAEVDDLVQDVFLDAIRGIHKLRDAEAARPWLALITVRKARRLLRKRRARRAFGLDEGADYTEVADSRASPEERARIAELYRVLDSIPANERLAWTLRYLEQEPLDRVAEICECSLATAKRRIAAAHAVITEEIGDD